MLIEKRISLTSEMKYRKGKGFKYIVSYNDTEKFLVFKDKYYRTIEGALRFYNKLSCGMKNINEL
ncbi:MAG: hypothetical protein ACRC92_21510 [Peptostreptococcaceae bacterium]